MRVVIINGPNLNLLGRREPGIYGTESFEDYLDRLRKAFKGVELLYFQSNYEGQLIDWLHDFGFSDIKGIVLNAGGYAHTSIALRDAIAAIDTPVINVHISDTRIREAFRQADMLEDVCAGNILGKGLPGYHQAIEQLLELN